MRSYILDNIACIKKCGVPSARRIKESDLSIVHPASVLAAPDRRAPIRSMRDLVFCPLSVLSHALGRAINLVDRRSAEFRISDEGREYYSALSQKTRAMQIDLLNIIDPEEMKNLNVSISKLTTFAEERAEALKENLQPAAARPTRNVIIQAG